MNLTHRVRFVHTDGMKRPTIDDVFDQAGGRAKLMESLGVSKQTLSDWKRQGHVSWNHAVGVEHLTGIPREQLCPDFDWTLMRWKQAEKAKAA